MLFDQPDALHFAGVMHPGTFGPIGDSEDCLLMFLERSREERDLKHTTLQKELSKLKQAVQALGRKDKDPHHCNQLQHAAAQLYARELMHKRKMPTTKCSCCTLTSACLHLVSNASEIIG